MKKKGGADPTEKSPKGKKKEGNAAIRSKKGGSGGSFE